MAGVPQEGPGGGMGASPSSWSWFLSLSGTSSDVWWSGEWQPRGQVCWGWGWGNPVSGGGGTGARPVITACRHGPTDDHAACDKDSAEWRMGTAVGRSQVWFRFNEGVSNAVRRSLHIRDLL